MGGLASDSSVAIIDLLPLGVEGIDVQPERPTLATKKNAVLMLFIIGEDIINKLFTQ